VAASTCKKTLNLFGTRLPSLGNRIYFEVFTGQSLGSILKGWRYSEILDYGTITGTDSIRAASSSLTKFLLDQLGVSA